MENNCEADKQYCSFIRKEGTIHRNPSELKKTNRHSNDQNNEEKSSLISKVTTEELSKLCDQLSIFNTRVQTINEIMHLRYDLPNKLQERLEVEAEELGSLYRELQDASKNIEIMRNQRLALVKEKLCIETQLDKLKADAVTELEIIVSVYDNIMMERWQNVKSANNKISVENFLQDVKGKLQAMKNLQILGTQKLADLLKEENKKEQNNFKKEKNTNKDSSAKLIRECLSDCNTVNVSQSTSSLSNTDSEFMDMSSIQNIMHNLVSEHMGLLSLPPWNQVVTNVD